MIVKSVEDISEFFILCRTLTILSIISHFQASLVAFSEYRLRFCLSAFAEIMLIFVGESAVHWAISIHQLAGTRLHRRCSRAWRITNLSGAATTRRGPLRNVPHKPGERRRPRKKIPRRPDALAKRKAAGAVPVRGTEQDGRLKPGWDRRAMRTSSSENEPRRHDALNHRPDTRS